MQAVAVDGYSRSSTMPARRWKAPSRNRSLKDSARNSCDVKIFALVAYLFGENVKCAL